MSAVGFRHPGGEGGVYRWLIEDEDSLTRMACPKQAPGNLVVQGWPRRSVELDDQRRSCRKAMRQRHIDTAFKYTCAAALFWVGCFHYWPMVLKKSVIWVWMMQKDWKEHGNANSFVSRR